ncbi:MAG: hypothetical protein P1Q69_04735 [Candidatus Thorarchaeota archaeon]|nr:hypothetical protein [Candidatus Thorarchaeota archaeon]
MKHLIDSEECQYVWGFEGCGAMWTFFSNQRDALKHAGTNEVLRFEVEEAHVLDNRRRQELGAPAISFDKFSDCIDHTLSCIPPEIDCEE